MNILIIGEWSAFAKNLASGFRKLGHEVVIFSYGDGWKRINQTDNDYSYDIRNYQILGKPLKGSKYIRGLFSRYKFKKDIARYKHHFDIVWIVSYQFLRLEHEFWSPKFSFEDIKKVIRNKERIYLSACGGDLPHRRFYKNFRYVVPLSKSSVDCFFHGRLFKIYRQCISQVAGIIPTSYGYAEAWRNNKDYFQSKVYQTLPLPINLENLDPYNEVKEKIVIYDGSANRIEKGGPVIAEALKIIYAKYPDKLTIISAGRKPFKEYLESLTSVNILIDQCCTYGYGMNAVIGMALGKVVLGGNEPEIGNEFKREDIPIINILPEIQDIVEKLEQLILNPSLIKKIGERSRKFAKEFHSDIIVAQQYLEIFEKKTTKHLIE